MQCWWGMNKLWLQEFVVYFNVINRTPSANMFMCILYIWGNWSHVSIMKTCPRLYPQATTLSLSHMVLPWQHKHNTNATHWCHIVIKAGAGGMKIVGCSLNGSKGTWLPLRFFAFCSPSLSYSHRHAASLIWLFSLWQLRNSELKIWLCCDFLLNGFWFVFFFFLVLAAERFQEEIF